MLRRSQRSLFMLRLLCSRMWNVIPNQTKPRWLIDINRTQHNVPMQLNSELVIGWMDKWANLFISHPHRNINQNSRVLWSSVDIRKKTYRMSFHESDIKLINYPSDHSVIRSFCKQVTKDEHGYSIGEHNHLSYEIWEHRKYHFSFILFWIPGI